MTHRWANPAGLGACFLQALCSLRKFLAGARSMPHEANDQREHQPAERRCTGDAPWAGWQWAGGPRRAFKSQRYGSVPAIGARKNTVNAGCSLTFNGTLRTAAHATRTLADIHAPDGDARCAHCNLRRNEPLSDKKSLAAGPARAAHPPGINRNRARPGVPVSSKRVHPGAATKKIAMCNESAVRMHPNFTGNCSPISAFFL